MSRWRDRRPLDGSTAGAERFRGRDVDPASGAAEQSEQPWRAGGDPHGVDPTAGRAARPPGPARALALLSARPWHLAVGSVAAGLALAGSQPFAPLGCAVALLAALAAAGLPLSGALAAGALLGGAAVGHARLDALDRPARLVGHEREVRLRAHLLTRPRAAQLGASAEVGVSSGRLDGARLLVRVPPWGRLPAGLDLGDELLLEGRLRPIGASDGGAARVKPGSSARGPAGARSEAGGDAPSPTGVDGGFDFASYLRRRGVAAELLLDRARPSGRRRSGVPGLLDRMRGLAERGVASGLPAREAALARGMVLGQDERIDAATREDFRDSGLAHLLAVSGQNVMLLVALALPFLAVAGLGPRVRGVALLLLVAMYVPLAGAGPSLQRAGVMGAAGIAALTMSRPASRWYALLLAAAITLLLNPRAWQDPGWQLSFAAVVGILTIGRPLAGALTRAGEALLRGARPPPGKNSGPSRGPLARGLVRALGEGVAITLAATLATAPLLAHHFDAVPLAGLPANLLALPAVAPAMWLGMVKAGLGLMAPLVPTAAVLAELAGAFTRIPVAYIAGLAERFADLPGARLPIPLRSPLGVGLTYCAIGIVAVGGRALARRAGRSAPELAAAWRRAPRSARTALVALAVALVALGAAEALTPPAAPKALTVRFLDVGQGDATLLQHPDGTAVLFDGGPPEAGIERLLRRAGVGPLSLVVATHASRDHHGGLSHVLARRRVELLLDGGDGSSDPGFRSVLAMARRRQVRSLPATAPSTLHAGGITIRILSPPPRPPGPAPEDPNPRAVVALVSSGEFDLLLSADAESEALLPLELPDVEAMKVPHHGSADSGLPELLERVSPELAAIEVGANTYGHPTPSTLAALRDADVATYRTDLHGTVTLTVHGTEMRVETER